MTESLGPAATYIGPSGETRDALGVFGRVTTAELEAVFQQRAFIGSTTNVALTADQILAIVLANPLGSGRNLFLTSRRFSTTQANSSAVLEYQAWINPTVVLSTPGVAVNRWQGAPVGVGTVRYQAGAAAGIVMGGTQGSGESVRTGGGATAREVLVILPPGQSLGFTLTGQGQNVGQAIRASITLEWFEQTVA